MKTLRDFWEAWKRLARRIGEAQARVLLTIFYFVILPPFALLQRLAARGPNGWQRPKPDADTSFARAARQW